MTIAFICVALVVPATFKHNPRAWVAPLPPPPQQLWAEITNQQLAGFRSVLASTEWLRKNYESRSDPYYSYFIANLLAREADCKRRIEELERGMLTPVPRMPIVLPGPTQPKPPVRD